MADDKDRALALLSEDGLWTPDDGGFIAGVLLGWPGLSDDDMSKMVSVLPDGVRDSVRRSWYVATPNRGGAQALDDVAYERRGDPAEAPDSPDGPQATFRIVKVGDMTGSRTPPQRPAIVQGLLRQGGKMLIAGPPKSHKSMEAIALSLAFATGGSWMGHRCERRRVLYLNIELDQTEFMNRIESERVHMGLDVADYYDSFDAVTLTGQSIDGQRPTGESTFAWLESNVSRGQYDVVVIDPIYKLEDGPEDHEQVNRLLGGMDEIRAMLDVTIVYVHHTAKGGNAGKTVYEVARGSGDWGGDADLVCAISEIQALKEGTDAWDKAEELGIRSPEHSAYRMMFGPRSFPDVPSVDCFKTWPCFTVDEDGVLGDLKMRGAAGVAGGEASAGRAQDMRQRQMDAIAQAIDDCASMGQKATRTNVYSHMATTFSRAGLKRPSEQTFKNWTSRPGGKSRWRVRYDSEGAQVLSECYQEPDGRAVYKDGKPMFLN